MQYTAYFVEKSRLIRLFLFALSIVLLSCTEGRPTFEAGTKPPVLSFKTINGEEKKLSDFFGKPFVLVFWASWCDTCKSEMPSLIALKDRLKDRGLEIVAVAVNDDFDQFKRYVQSNQLNFTVGFEGTGKANELYKLTGVPEAFVVDASGAFVLLQDPDSGDATVRIVGPRDWNSDILSSQIARLVSAG